MAAKKTTRNSSSKAMTRWEEELAREAQVAAATEQNAMRSGATIGLRAGVLTFNGNQVPGNKMNVVVLDSVFENKLYGEKYDPENPVPPICYALGRVEKELKPHEKSEDPQNDACADCPMNKFGTSETGRGKACKNSRRLAVIAEDDLENVDTLAEESQIAVLSPPVTSVANWAAYVTKVAETVKRPPFGVVTEVSVVPDPKHQFKVLFKLVSVIEDSAVFEALLEARKRAAAILELPYQERSREEPARGKQRGGARRPVVAGGKAGGKAGIRR